MEGKRYDQDYGPLRTYSNSCSKTSKTLGCRLQAARDSIASWPSETMPSDCTVPISDPFPHRMPEQLDHGLG